VPAIRTPNHEKHSLKILDAFESDHGVSQRSLASELGIALGLTNLLVKRLVRKGWVQVSNIKPNRVRYLITPTGIAEKTRLSREYFDSSLHFYRKTRTRIQGQFAALSRDWPTNGVVADKRIVFYGAGEEAEIGYVCLPETDLHLVGIVDPSRTSRFFNLTISPPSALDGLSLNGESFGRLVVMSFGNPEALRAEIQALRVPQDCVFWL
jgi:DNA-binding MarR family transcriptional regulator